MQLEAGGVQRSGNARALRGLTFDMSGGPKGAKRPLERPLDGGVRFQAYYSSVRNATWEMPASRMAAKATSTA